MKFSGKISLGKDTQWELECSMMDSLMDTPCGKLCVCVCVKEGGVEGENGKWEMGKEAKREGRCEKWEEPLNLLIMQQG